MNTTKFWITSIATIAAAGTLGFAIAQTTYGSSAPAPAASEQKDQGGSTAGGAANQEPAAKNQNTAQSTAAPSDSGASTPAAEQPKAKADRG